MTKLLIVEDEQIIANGLREGFEFEGYTVVTATDGQMALRTAKREQIDAIILDIMLPKLDGMSVCKRLRGLGYRTPIIMLTARGLEIDKVSGLRIGADDYVTKPFSFMELLARLEALLRRASALAPQEPSYGGLTLQPATMEVTKDGVPVRLTPHEFRILQYLIEHRNRIVTRDQLLDAVWGMDCFPFTRTVDMAIAKLRKKLDNPKDPRLIVTVHGVGYRFLGGNR